jgi:hypothetical protein
MEPDAAEKVQLCLHRMQLSRSAAAELIDPTAARTCARGTFLYLDSFLHFAPQVRNAHKDHPRAGEVKKLLKRLDADYHKFYDGIRDQLTAHQVPMGPLEAVLLFVEIDQTAVDILVEDAVAVYSGLRDMEPRLLPAPQSTDLTTDAAMSALRTAVEPGPVVQRLDRLALANPGVVGMVPLSSGLLT